MLHNQALTSPLMAAWAYKKAPVNQSISPRATYTTRSSMNGLLQKIEFVQNHFYISLYDWLRAIDVYRAETNHSNF